MEVKREEVIDLKVRNNFSHIENNLQFIDLKAVKTNNNSYTINLTEYEPNFIKFDPKITRNLKLSHCIYKVKIIEVYTYTNAPENYFRICYEFELWRIISRKEFELYESENLWYEKHPNFSNKIKKTHMHQIENYGDNIYLKLIEKGPEPHSIIGEIFGKAYSDIFEKIVQELYLRCALTGEIIIDLDDEIKWIRPLHTDYLIQNKCDHCSKNIDYRDDFYYNYNFPFNYRYMSWYKKESYVYCKNCFELCKNTINEINDYKLSYLSSNNPYHNPQPTPL